MLLSSCEGNAANCSQISRPIAQEQISNGSDFQDVLRIIVEFADRHQFAVQRSGSGPQGLLDFDIHLFRDDIRMTISRMNNDPIDVAAFSLCACDTERRGIQSTAQSAVSELARDLAR